MVVCKHGYGVFGVLKEPDHLEMWTLNQWIFGKIELPLTWTWRCRLGLPDTYQNAARNLLCGCRSSRSGEGRPYHVMSDLVSLQPAMVPPSFATFANRRFHRLRPLTILGVNASALRPVRAPARDVYTWNPNMTSVLIRSLTMFWVGGPKIEVELRLQVYIHYICMYVYTCMFRLIPTKSIKK